MGRVMEHGGATEGYEAVPLALPEDAGPVGSGAAVLRRRSARPGRRAVVYVHCRGDSFVPEDLVSWYTDRGFHFYAADLRAVGADGARAPMRAGRPPTSPTASRAWTPPPLTCAGRTRSTP